MRTSLASVRCWCLGAWLALGAGCAGTTAATPLAAPAAASSAAAAPTPVTATPAAPARIDSVDERLLCGTPLPVSPGAPPLEQLRQDLRGLEQDLAKKGASTAAAAAPSCKAEVDSFAGIFDQLSSSSQTLCDRQAAAGVGVDADTLMRETAALVADINERRSAIETGDDAECVARRDLLALRFTEWRAQRDRLCAPTNGQNAVIACGTGGSNAASKAAAARICSALDKNSEVPEADMQQVEACVAKQSQGNERALVAPAGAGDRGIAPSELQTTLLNGAADFFAERAQQEVTLFAYEVVENRLCDTEAVKPFLKNTCELFDAEQTLAPTPATIREAVRADLDALPAVLVTQVKAKTPALACPTALAWSFGEVAIEGADVLELLANPDVVLNNPLVLDGCSASVRADLASIAAELQRLLEKGRSDVERSVQAGAFDRAVEGPNTRTLRGVLTPYGKVLKEVMMRVKQLDQAMKAWERNPTDANRAAVVVAGLRTIQPMVRFAVERDPHLDPKTRAAVTKSTQLAIELTGQILNHEYAAVVVTGAQIASLAQLETGKVRNLLGLAASLADAESSDDVRTTLEEAALPVGSWRRKNEYRWGATLTGMVGVQAAHELVIEDAPRAAGMAGDAPQVTSGPSFGPSLLIGADIHHGLCNGTRLGVQVTALDLGALLTVRLDDPEVEDGATDQTAKDNPELSVEQVFSPGIYPYFGFGPIDVGAGLSFVPALRSVDTGAETSGLNVLRLGVFVAVDVSVLPLL